jgi:PIN domain nuclease of toxin-antitoxin system
MATTRLLLDTHVFLWMQSAPERLPPGLRARLEDPAIELLLSAASAWEIAVKARLGRLVLPEPPEKYLPSRMTRQQVGALPIHQAHALRAAALPAHHKDPFDRLLVAQAQVEQLALVSADRLLGQYEVEILWAETG